MRNKAAFLKSPLSVLSILSILLFVISVPVYLIAMGNPKLADFLNSTVSHALRTILGTLNRIFPFSLFELLIILALPLLVLLIYLGIKFGKNIWGRVRFIAVLLGVISLIATSYIYTLGIGYHTTPLADKMEIENRSDISREELIYTYLLVLDEVNHHAELVQYEGAESRMPYSIGVLSDKLSLSYRNLASSYSFLKTYTTRAKPVLFSTVMSDAGIMGIYSFFSGEPNVNVEYPDYTLPFTAAHEFAHARGISRENEANFTAFLVCINSDDAYIRYSGYLNMYEYLSSALYSLDKDTYLELKDGLSDNARLDLIASRRVSEEHKDTLIGKINNKLNDFYLKSNGTEGVVTYGYVVRLSVSYYIQMSQ